VIIRVFLPDESFKAVPVTEESTVQEVAETVVSKLVTQETFNMENIAKFAIYEEPLEGKNTTPNLLEDQELILTIKDKWESSKKQFRFVFRDTSEQLRSSEVSEKVREADYEIFITRNYSIISK
jgi:hypothetical protein